MLRIHQLTGDPWQEDPACYLTDEELGIMAGELGAKAKPSLQALAAV